VALVEDPQSGGEHRVLTIVGRMAALDADQLGDHRVPAADRVGKHLPPQLRVLTIAKPSDGGLGEGDVEHVQVAATAAEADHLTIERDDHRRW
jgi:hypothetical protein